MKISRIRSDPFALADSIVDLATGILLAAEEEAVWPRNQDPSPYGEAVVMVAHQLDLCRADAFAFKERVKTDHQTGSLDKPLAVAPGALTEASSPENTWSPVSSSLSLGCRNSSRWSAPSASPFLFSIS